MAGAWSWFSAGRTLENVTVGGHGAALFPGANLDFLPSDFWGGLEVDDAVAAGAGAAEAGSFLSVPADLVSVAAAGFPSFDSFLAPAL